MTASPDNYFIGKGIVSFKKTGAAEYRDLGNVPELEWTPELDELEHFSSRQGVRTRDKTVIIEKKATMRLILEEWTTENLALAFLGDVETTGTSPNEVTKINLFSQNAITGALRYVGTNDVGPKYQFDALNVTLIPSGSGIGFITDEWGQMELNAEIGVDSEGDFATLTVIEDEA